MASGATDILQQVLQAGAASADPARSCKQILQTLQQHWQLSDAQMLRLNEARTRYLEKIRARGADFFMPWNRPVPPAEAKLLQAQSPGRLSNRRMLLPLVAGGHVLGVLSLVGTRLPAVQQLTAMGAYLAALLNLTGMATRAEQEQGLLSLWSELGRRLNRATTPQQVLQASARTLFQHTAAAAVLLRPLHGETVLDRCYFRVHSAHRGDRPVFLQYEELQLQAALSAEAPRNFTVRSAHHTQTPPLYYGRVLPLRVQDRLQGVLTLFFPAGGDRLQDRWLLARRGFLTDVGLQLAQALERVQTAERDAALAQENARKLAEISQLYRFARLLHSTVRLNELTHLLLSATTAEGGGGFERAMLFMVNLRSSTLQGMLGISRETAGLVLPDDGPMRWERPVLDAKVLDAQRRSAWCQAVQGQRLALTGDDNLLARAVARGQVTRSKDPEQRGGSLHPLEAELSLGPYACAPLVGQKGVLAVLVVDNPRSREEISADRLRFLELLAHQAGAAMENCLLLQRLEAAHQELREAQDAIIQGEKLAVLGEMAASVAHELKNPLVLIGGFAARLVGRLDQAPTEAREYAQVIAREVRRMEELLSGILGFSQKQILCYAECQVNEVVAEVLRLEQEAMQCAGIALHSRLKPDLPVIQGDALKLRQVVNNLLSNARQAVGSTGWVKVSTATSQLRGEAAVAIVVEDSGGGVPANLKQRLFTPFVTTKSGGTGLGLSITQRIVQHHMGQIEVRNLAQGAQFTVRLPVRIPSKANR